MCGYHAIEWSRPKVTARNLRVFAVHEFSFWICRCAARDARCAMIAKFEMSANRRLLRVETDFGASGEVGCEANRSREGEIAVRFSG